MFTDHDRLGLARDMHRLLASPEPLTPELLDDLFLAAKGCVERAPLGKHEGWVFIHWRLRQHGMNPHRPEHRQRAVALLAEEIGLRCPLVVRFAA